MDTENTLNNLSDFLTVLGTDSWNRIIPDIDNVNFTKSNSNDLHLKDISYGNINVISDQKYTGEEILPEITIEFDGKSLKNDVDYDVVYLNNINPGKAEVVIVGLGEYSGILTSGFYIKEN